MRVIDTSDREDYTTAYRCWYHFPLRGVTDYDAFLYTSVDGAIERAQELMAKPKKLRAYDWVGIMAEKIVRRVVDE
jgi:hypothetical protein